MKRETSPSEFMAWKMLIIVISSVSALTREERTLRGVLVKIVKIRTTTHVAPLQMKKTTSMMS